MRNEKGNTMKTQQENTTTWSECECEACTSETETKTEAKGFENHQGDGPSGYDYFSDTRRWC